MSESRTREALKALVTVLSGEDGGASLPYAIRMPLVQCKIALELGDWVSVEERRPEYGELVQVTNGKDVKVGCLYRYNDPTRAPWWQLFPAQDETWGIDGSGVTHWQPLPAPPKEKQS